MAIQFKVSDIEENASKRFDVDDTYSIFVVKRDNQLFAYKNSCPHLGIELEWNENQFLDSEGALIQCSTHGALFIIETGECVSGPCLGDKLTPLEIQVDNSGNALIEP